jgi:hypothetical protein
MFYAKGFQKLLAIVLALALCFGRCRPRRWAGGAADTAPGNPRQRRAGYRAGFHTGTREKLSQPDASEGVRLLDTAHDEKQARIDALLENIAQRYAQSYNDAWHVMGVAAYADRYGSNFAQDAKRSSRISIRPWTPCRGSTPRIRRLRRPS